jgi:hypothetical protein
VCLSRTASSGMGDSHHSCETFTPGFRRITPRGG